MLTFELARKTIRRGTGVLPPSSITVKRFLTQFDNLKMKSKRGTLIVFEGCDRSGKTTVCKRIIEELNDNEVATLPMRFPERSTKIGSVIDQYLRNESKLDDHVVHLLFSANRWEKVSEMREALAAGTNIIIDRYAFSGVAFSAAKEGLSMEWCKQPDRGLPKPDLVCFLDVSPQEAKQRGDFGKERYEKEEFQIKVRKNYDQLMDDSWKVIDTDKKTLDKVYQEVNEQVKKAIEAEKEPAIDELWPMA